MNNSTANVFFNSATLENDLDGDLRGSVLFCQATILPSKASVLSDDIQPRLVSFRDTMVLFKPLTQNINVDNEFSLNVKDENNVTVFSTAFKNPDLLPDVAERLDVDESTFLDPLTYDYVISTQSEFNKLKDDVNGIYLSKLLETVNSIKIVTSDGNWIKDIYLPEELAGKSGKLITFERHATSASTISYSSKTITPVGGRGYYFRIFEDAWNMPSDLPYSQVESVFIDPGKYDYIISSLSEIRETANDPQCSHLKSVFADHDTIRIELADGRWADVFYLPDNDPSLNGKKIIFNSNAGYSARVYYSGVSLSIQNGTTLTFVNNNGAWAEWSDSQYAKISYGQNFWHALIPWKYIYPGVSFQFLTDNMSGVYKNADIGSPGELLLNTVDLGMLTPNREAFSFQYNDDYHRQYFQQIPASRLIVNEYEPVYWKEIMLPDGTLYQDHSNDEGGVYSGDLRAYIGKELVSLGINNANYGIHSSPGTGEDGLNNRFAAAQLTAHNSVGNYVNGRVVHGLSGGAGMVTLESSVGNEFSHEVGHNYGLGHYPNGFSGSIHRSAENINSTWGWDSDKNVFIPNFEKSQLGSNACYDNECQPPFDGHRFGADAMAGGEPFYTSVNAYTLYTPYTLHHIQKFLEEKVVFDAGSSTGYKKWNEETKSMEEWAEAYSARPDELDFSSMSLLIKKYILIDVYQYDGSSSKDIFIPQADYSNKYRAVHIVYNATDNATVHVDGKAIVISRGSVLNYESNGSTWESVDDFSFNVVSKPEQQGVPVTTILGYYDPDNILPSYAYPALHCASGSTYHSNRDLEVSTSRCYAEIKNDKNQSLKFTLRGERVNGDVMNRLHINVASSFAPTSITIYSDNVPIVTKRLLPPSGKTHVTVNGRQ
ncbi:M66 family metalloprotease [Brucella intermedia]|uniref:M66 family metalloprotease n=1 Tax=Brucella intermedia TaxID=94625 RepID=UPI002362C6EC|nr:M66 family metalloprotease [Brucella intermedia]